MNDTHHQIVAEIVAAMEEGVMPWLQTWTAGEAPGMPKNADTGRAYSGVNILVLWTAASRRRFTCHRWVTFRQSRNVAGGVRKGSRGTRAVFAKQFVPETERQRIAAGEITEGEARRIWCLRQYVVFNLDQVRDVPPELLAPEGAAGFATDLDAEAFMKTTGADIRTGGGHAYYRPHDDYVVLPDVSRFSSSEEYYCVAFHELAHWTGHPARLDRGLKADRSERSYAFEELVAELAATFLCAALGVLPHSRSRDYLGSWLSEIREDPRYLFVAARHASAASEYLLRRSREASAIR